MWPSFSFVLLSTVGIVNANPTLQDNYILREHFFHHQLSSCLRASSPWCSLCTERNWCLCLRCYLCITRGSIFFPHLPDQALVWIVSSHCSHIIFNVLLPA